MARGLLFAAQQQSQQPAAVSQQQQALAGAGSGLVLGGHLPVWAAAGQQRR
jgi:hypothetical protein